MRRISKRTKQRCSGNDGSILCNLTNSDPSDGAVGGTFRASCGRVLGVKGPRDGVAGVDHVFAVVEDGVWASDRETALTKAEGEQGAHASAFLWARNGSTIALPNVKYSSVVGPETTKTTTINQ